MDYDALFKRRDLAARRIQAAWRAYRGRKAFLRLRDAVGRIQAAAKGWYVRKQVQDQRNRQHLEQRFEAAMDRHREKMRVLEAERRTLLAMPGGEMEEWEARRLRAVITVQAHWRGLVVRRKLAQSPERVAREKAARRIQTAFRNVLRSRRGTAALASAAGASAAFKAAGLRGTGASPAGGRPSPPGVSALRQSGGSVLMGSPTMRGSPATADGGGVGSRGSSPLRRRQGAGSETVGAGGGAGSGAARNASVMGPRRYKELQAQVDGKLGAYVALARSRGSHRRADPRVTEAWLAALLRQHETTAAERLAAVAERQRGLVLCDTLCEQLEQLRPLADLPADAAPQDFPRPARGSERAERAAQAHALALAEAKIGNRWWTHLRALNTQAVQDALTAEDEERWEALDARWRRKWMEVEEQENRRPDAVDEARGGRSGGAGAAAVAAAREAAALQSKQDEYAARIAKAAPAVPRTAPAPGSGSGSGSGHVPATTAARAGGGGGGSV